ncbi:MAG TPA: hypothetical protein VHQ65_01175 [Thermoanaerobaculia bacterium]|nr:hypothetical protein [Thermoanaerobaculia bacterium]
MLLVPAVAAFGAAAEPAPQDDQESFETVTAPLTVEPGMFVENGGLVGVGTSNPQTALHVNASSSSVIRMQNAGGVRLEFRDDANNVQWDFRTTSGNTFTIARLTPTPANMMMVLSNGDLRIAGSLLTQNGTNVYPDYVFEPDYPLMPLAEVASFIETEKHLPGIRSAEEVRRQGAIDMSELQLQLLRKVEELTLYTIQQQKEIERLQARLDAADGEPAN